MKITALGSVPDSVILGAGKPVVVAWNENVCPIGAGAEAALVISGISRPLSRKEREGAGSRAEYVEPHHGEAYGRPEITCTCPDP